MLEDGLLVLDLGDDHFCHNAMNNNRFALACFRMNGKMVLKVLLVLAMSSLPCSLKSLLFVMPLRYGIL